MEASSVNAPHPDGDAEDADDFFGGEQEETSSSDPRTVLERQEDAYQYAATHGEPVSDELAAAHEEYMLEESDAAREAAELPPPAEPEPEPAAASGGSLAREYMVFQKVPLTEKTLKALLAQIEQGIKPRVAFIELGRAETRNDKQAIGEVYMAHQDELGERCELAAVSARAFKERKIAPEEVPAEKRIKIS